VSGFVFSFEHLAAGGKNNDIMGLARTIPGIGEPPESRKLGVQVMCQSCEDINKRVERHRELLRSTTDPAEIERIKRLISELYADRVRLHQNPKR
jgi:hypothetical protein